MISDGTRKLSYAVMRAVHSTFPFALFSFFRAHRPLHTCPKRQVRIRSRPRGFRQFFQFQAGKSQNPLGSSRQSTSTVLYAQLRPSSSQPLIRVLELLPGHGSHPVEAVLKEVCLSDHVFYEAVSYCWGDPQDVSTITCNGRLLLVPRRLETALRDVRYHDRPRTIWADAICINQTDLAERESQVNLMRRIFSKAQRTLIWLGGEEEKRQQKMSIFASTTIKMGVSIFRRRVNAANSPQVRVWERGESCHSHEVAPFSTDFYHELIGMLRVPWFQRAWVVQEVAVSSKATIFWGNARYDWEDVIRALKFMSEANFPLAFIVTLENISAIDEERKFYKEGNNKLSGVLLRHQRCMATDPRDKIYSFCGLVETSTKSRPPVRVTYKDDVAVVYQGVALQILEQDRSLDLLSRPPLPTKSTLRAFPSWVPDLSISSASNLTYAWGHGPLSLAGTELAGKSKKSRFCAADGTIYTPKSPRKDGTLEVEGYTFDKIIEVGPIFEGVRLPTAVQSFPDIVHEWIKCIRSLLRARKVFTRWQEVANVRSTSPYITGEAMREAFLQTVSVAEIHDSERIKVELDLWERGSRFPFGLPYSAFVFVRNFLTNKPWLLFEIQGRYTLQRRVVKTENGYLGLASRDADVGDYVALCKGSSVPLIFRVDGVENSFLFVGDVYVHGIMRGEAFREDKCHSMLLR